MGVLVRISRGFLEGAKKVEVESSGLRVKATGARNGHEDAREGTKIGVLSWRLFVPFCGDCLGFGCRWSLGAACAPDGSTRLRKKEMKGPQGLGDSGAEASNEAREAVRPSRVRIASQRFRRSPSLPPDICAASRVSNDVQHGFRMCRFSLKSIGCRDQAETVHRRRVHIGSNARRSFRS